MGGGGDRHSLMNFLDHVQLRLLADEVDGSLLYSGKRYAILSPSCVQITSAMFCCARPHRPSRQRKREEENIWLSIDGCLIHVVLQKRLR